MRGAFIPGQKLIDQRRRLEHSRREMEAATAYERKISLMTNFENSSNQRIDRRTKQQLFEAKRKQYEDNLLHRRRKLADLYNREMDQWRKEVLSKVETMQDRKERIRQRAYALKEAREKARQEIANQKYDEQWRSSCDDARTLDSKSLELYMNQERLKQIQEKVQRKQRLSQQEDSYLQEWYRQLEELEKRDREKEELRRRIDQETSAALRAQMAENAMLKQQFYVNLKLDDDEELKKLREDIETEEYMQQQRRVDARNRQAEVTQFNKECQRWKDEEQLVEREQDAILLDYALRKEKEAMNAEERKRMEDRHAAMQYRTYLQEQMVKEAEDTAFIDNVRRQEEEKVWKARDDALRARDEARQRLMGMVDDGRQEQIRYKYEQTMKERDEEERILRHIQEQLQIAEAEERRKEQARKEELKSNQSQLLHQISRKEHVQALQAQEAYLEDKEMRYREKMHQQKLAQQAGSYRLNHPIQKNNWFT